MSDGRVFADDRKGVAEDNLVENVVDLQRKFSVILEKIQIYDKIVAEQAALHQKIKDLLIKNEQLDKSINAQKQEILAFNSSLSITRNLYNKELEQHEGRIESVENETRKHTFIHGTDLQDVRDCLRRLQSDLQSCSEHYKQAVNESHKSLQELREKQQHHSELLCQFVASYRLMPTKLNDLESQIQHIQESQQKERHFHHAEIVQMKSELSAKLDEVRMAHSQQAQGIQQQMNETFDLIRKEMRAPSPTMESFKRDVMQKIELASIDCGNANVRSLNTEQQMKLCEKKIESLSVLMKKHELSK